MPPIEGRAGSYALAMELPEAARIQVGRLGRFDLERGFYIYVGSALGPGGLRARVGRHLRDNKKKHWHIDYLLPYVRPSLLLFAYSDRRCEHSWASALAGSPSGLLPIPGFGASDCACSSHLVLWQGAASARRLIPRLQAVSPNHVQIHVHRLDR